MSRKASRKFGGATANTAAVRAKRSFSDGICPAPSHIRLHNRTKRSGRVLHPFDAPLHVLVALSVPLPLVVSKNSVAAMVEGRVLYESALAKALFHLSMSEGLIVPEKWGAAAGEATTAAAAAAADTIFGFDLCQNFWAFDYR